MSACPPPLTIEGRFEANRRLAYSIANRFVRGGVLRIHKEEIEQAALEGLWKACLRFDPTRGVRFAGYAYPLIVGEIRHLIDRERRHAIRFEDAGDIPSLECCKGRVLFVAPGDNVSRRVEDRDALDSYLDRIPEHLERARRVVELRLRGYTLQEIGDQFDPPITRETVRQHLFRAAEHMRIGQ